MQCGGRALDRLKNIKNGGAGGCLHPPPPLFHKALKVKTIFYFTQGSSVQRCYNRGNLDK